MATNITPKHQQQFLQDFLAYLKELQYSTALIETPAGEDHNYSTLNIVLDISSEMLQGENFLQMEAAFLPQVEDDLDGQSILQMMVPILVADENVDKKELFALIIKLNTFMPMGSFGYWEEQNMIYHKQNNIIGKKTDAEHYATYEEQVGMIQYVLTSFVPSIAAVAIDGANMQKALEDNPFARVFVS